MMVIWGTTLYGKTDEVPGVFHVATECSHLYYFPLLPHKSYLVLEHTSSGFRGIPINRSWKSLGVAWLRAVLTVLLIFSGVYTLTELFGTKFHFSLLNSIATTVGLSLALWRSYHWRRLRYATYERAIQLATAAGFNEVGMLAIGVHFGKISAEQAAATRQTLAEAGVQEVLAPGAAVIAPPRR